MITGNVREALTVLLTVLIGGAVLVQLADRTFHLGPALGNALYTALPLVAGFVAISRLDPEDPYGRA